jgi:flagellar hook-associated protein FlgK
VNQRIFRAVASCLVLAGVACGGEKGASSSAPAADTAAKPASASSVGVAECDDYIQKYEACVSNKVPAQAQASMRAAFDQMRTTWKQTAANPQARASLASACTQAKDMARQSMQAYGCTW